MSLTNADLAAQVSALIAKWAAYTGQLKDWLGGTATGGPHGDGRYPLQDSLGNTYYIECPSAMQANVESTIAGAAGYAASAESAKDDAVAAKVAAEAAKVLALAYRDDALAAKVLAQNARDEAATSAANLDSAVSTFNSYPMIYVQADDPADEPGIRPDRTLWIWDSVKRRESGAWVTVA